MKNTASLLVCLATFLSLAIHARAGVLNNWQKFGADIVARKTLESQGVDPQSKEGRLIRTIAVEGVYGDTQKMLDAAKEIAETSVGGAQGGSAGGVSAIRTVPRISKLAGQADAGSVQSMKLLGGILYYASKGDSSILDLSFKYFKMASDKGDMEATAQTGHHYFYGIGTAANKAVGFKMLNNAAEKGDRDAQVYLAVVHATDSKYLDYKKALYWAERQKSGNPQSIKVYKAIKSHTELLGMEEAHVVQPEQSFTIDFERFGKARFEFVSNEKFGGPYYRLPRFRLHTDKCDYYMTPQWEGPYSYKIVAVSFADLNNDGMKDITVIVDVLYSRPGEILTWPNTEIWLATESGQFYTCGALNEMFAKCGTIKKVRTLAKSLPTNACSADKIVYGTQRDPHGNVTVRYAR